MMLTIELKRAPAGKWADCALRVAKAAAEANEIDWDRAHVRVKLPGRKAFVKLPGHLAMKGE